MSALRAARRQILPLSRTQGSERAGSYETPSRVPYRTDFPTYSTAHRRVRSIRGPARSYPCVDCGGPADEWSYDHADEEQLTESRGSRVLTYSANPAHYDARCKDCHWRFDQPVRGARSGESSDPRCGTYAGVQAHRKSGSAVCAACLQAQRAYAREWRRKSALRPATAPTTTDETGDPR